jgi:hypothetical protein
MTRLEDRQILVRDIEQACADGARLAPACALAGIDAGTLRRWKRRSRPGARSQRRLLAFWNSCRYPLIRRERLPVRTTSLLRNVAVVPTVGLS